MAQDLGYLTVPEGLIIDAKDVGKFGDNVVMICTGSQGEPLAALSRMANGEHEIVVGKGDTVILASSLIPGNENPVYRIINELTRLGAKVVHKGNAMVHVSGHAAAGELLYCYNIVKPKHVMPIHGEWRHLRANAELALKTGVARNKTLVVENGITIDGPDIHARGFTEDAALFNEVTGMIEKAMAHAVASGINGTHQLQQVVRKTVGSWVGDKHRRKPMIVPVVIEV